MGEEVETSTGFIEHVLPSGDKVFSRESNHSYWSEIVEKKDGTFSGKGRMASVSGVAGPFDWNPDNLMGWAAKLDNVGVAELYSKISAGQTSILTDHLWWLESGDTIRQALTDNGLSWRDQRDKAASRGTNVHKHALEALADGEMVDFDMLEPHEVGYARAVAGFWLDHDPQVLAAEAVVGCKDRMVAGRFDLLCRLNDDVCLLDVKTSRFLSAKFAVQLAGYSLLCEESGWPKPTKGLILQVGEDASYNLVELELDHEDFDTALRVYRRAAEIKKAMRKASKGE